MNKKAIKDLLPLYFEGKLNKEDVKYVEKWCSLSGKNHTIFMQMQKIYETMDMIHTFNSVDENKALKKLHKKINKQHNKYIWTWIQRAAAILFIPLLGITVANHFSTEEKPIQKIELTTAPGMIAKTTLPDGTKVILNSSSTLIYPSSFTKKTRDIQLNGEAYFEVTENKKCPFIVETPQKANIQVYGTEFNVDAYDSSPTVSATLVNGSIAMTYNNSFSEHIIQKIHPGQKICYSVQNHQAEVSQTDVDIDTSWKDGKLIFRNTPFRKVIHKLGQRFGVHFIVMNPQYYETEFTGVLEQQRLDKVLEYFRISADMKFKYIDSLKFENEMQTIEIY